MDEQGLILVILWVQQSWFVSLVLTIALNSFLEPARKLKFPGWRLVSGFLLIHWQCASHHVLTKAGLGLACYLILVALANVRWQALLRALSRSPML